LFICRLFRLFLKIFFGSYQFLLPVRLTDLTHNNSRPYRQEPWHECFTTVNKKEFDALIYSLYVMARDDKKLDGYEYYECINRLQSKCRYRVRARRMNEFIIVEERGGHNHAMEPVGTPGTHAGLPKTLREIVDRSFYEDWNNAVRQEKLEEEVRRLGLPHNPRLGRQVDNRIAYLRRVKNLNEMKKIQDQVCVAEENFRGEIEKSPNKEKMVFFATLQFCFR
uniref:FLYWCH-type domain-containing protein n=1 Tax=Haemonchus placei TaxID=6290 RepID=A0A0N4X152_HAEPC